MAENPVTSFRRLHKMTAARFAGTLGVSLASVRNAESGHLMEVPERWRAAFENMGWDLDALAVAYRAYKMDRARRIVASWNERQGQE